MKMILPVFLAFCLGVAPVFSQDIQASAVEAVAVAADPAQPEAETASAAPAAPDTNAVAAAEAEEALMFGSDVPQLSMLRAFGAIGMVLCALIGVYFGIRKFAPGYFPKISSGGKNLKIVESLGMGDRRSIALVEVGGKRFLIGSTPQQINLLTALPEHISLVAEDDGISDAAVAPVIKEDDERQVFRNLFDMGKKRSVRHSGNVLPDEVRQKMRRLREALENR
jgi:flagellar biosynthetic protein FliO